MPQPTPMLRTPLSWKRLWWLPPFLLLGLCCACAQAPLIAATSCPQMVAPDAQALVPEDYQAEWEAKMLALGVQTWLQIPKPSLPEPTPN